MVSWFSLPLLPRKRLIKNHAVCCNFPGLSVSNSTSSPSSYSFSITSFCQRLLMDCGSYVTSFAESFQIIAEGFVCFCEKRVSDNGKRLIQRWTSQVSIKGCTNSGERFFIVKCSVSPSCRQVKPLQALVKLLVNSWLKFLLLLKPSCKTLDVSLFTLRF